ncbi:hypothetical protein T10_8090 [Trichinella papuae]|uniref:Uncharacterized protein n=1 Tax=Trichinella papuae TaxID=268474 RepID=A0A0V1M3M0_9BILA|nr:hypothetical protein T10_11661 [Trichinella papuae]KRZ66121.1 hypothetical protein T10_281 [Trichinella papuae]KRZ66124.1 hypothetical protein T10_8090 [Trichinella papuae]
MDGKKLLIPFKYNLECTIHASGSPGCQQSNVGTHSGSSGSLGIALPGGCTSWNRTEKMIRINLERKAQNSNARANKNEFDGFELYFKSHLQKEFNAKRSSKGN